MSDARLHFYSPDELRDQLQEELARNPFLATERIAPEASVRVHDGDAWITGTVVEYRGGEYEVRLHDGRTLMIDGAVLERDNPDAPRAGA